MAARVRGGIDDVEMVRLWCAGGTLTDIAAKLGVSKQALSMRATKLRSLGVRLPKLSGRGVNVEALNALIANSEAK